MIYFLLSHIHVLKTKLNNNYNANQNRNGTNKIHSIHLLHTKVGPSIFTVLMY